MSLFHRKFIATLLMVVALGIGFPALGTAGGCDEPGYTGGSCGKSDTQGNSGGAAGDPPDPGDEPPPGNGGGGGDDQIVLTPGTESAATVMGMLSGMARSILTFLYTLPVK